MKQTIILLALTTILTTFFTGCSERMTAEEVLSRMTEANQQRMSNIEDVVIVYDNNTKYQKKATLNGDVIYKTRTEMIMEGGGELVTLWDGSYLWVFNPASGHLEKQEEDFDASDMLQNLKGAELKYARGGIFDGHDAHLLDIVGMGEMMGMQELEGVSFQVWIDGDDWTVLQMHATIKDKDDKPVELMSIRFKDYQEHEGMLIAHSTVISMAGMENIMEVQEVRVNTGLPDELFDGDLLEQKKEE